MMTEREERQAERLKTVNDYFNEFESLFELVGSVPEAQLEKIMSLLLKNLRKKYKYIIRISKKYQRRQNIFSIWRDKLKEKRRDAELEEEYEDEEEPNQQQEVPLISNTTTKVEVLENKEEDKMLTW